MINELSSQYINGEALTKAIKTFRGQGILKQLNPGRLKEIDTAICNSLRGCNSQRWFSLTARNVNTRSDSGRYQQAVGCELVTNR